MRTVFGNGVFLDSHAGNPNRPRERVVDGKSNEIKEIPELLDMLALKGAIILIDAMGTQKAIAAKIVEQEADYVLALKGNHSTLRNDVDGCCAAWNALISTTGKIKSIASRNWLDLSEVNY